MISAIFFTTLALIWAVRMLFADPSFTDAGLNQYRRDHFTWIIALMGLALIGSIIEPVGIFL